MQHFIKNCIELALKAQVNAQIFGTISESVTYTFKALTKETLIQKNKNSSVSINIEKDGRKTSLRYAYRPELKAEDVIQEALSLLVFATPDPAEVLPVVTGSFTGEARYFNPENMITGVESCYTAGRNSLEKTWYIIDSCIAGAGWEEEVFANTFWALKTSTTTSSYFMWALSSKEGTQGGDTEYFSRDSQELITFDESWTEECVDWLRAKLTAKNADFDASTTDIAVSNDLAGELVWALLGFLSGYAIAEWLTPFKKEHIGDKILPKWATIQSISQGKNLSTTQFYDKNGITTQDIVVIENGVLKNIFLSKAAGDRLGLAPNGQPGPVNVLFSATPPKNNLNGVVFLFTFLAGMHTMDTATWNFTLEGEGYQIENGEKTHYVKNVGFSGNIRELFSSLIWSLNDTRDYGSIRIPTLIFEKQKITPASN